MNASSDFSKKVVSQLSKKGVTVIGKTAIPAFEGDVYFSGTAYVLDAAGTQIVRIHRHVCQMAASSWTPECLDENHYMNQF